LSLLLRPTLSPEDVPLIPFASGIGVLEALRGLGAPAELKWPNDVLIAGRKVGGVLVEAAWSEGGLESVVVGVGVNVSVDPGAVPGVVSREATSLARELGRDVPVEDVAALVLEQLPLWYHRLAAHGRTDMIEAWRARSVPWWGRSVEVNVGPRSLRGVACGIDDTGALLVEVDGRVVTIVAGEARALRLG
jgi:BirA family biotin operon repressor/biotin-[acetyl-CoA-carboxylase] ligase